ncbi:PD-(D/E)XK nuclease family protein [Saccharicrinis aurantiacus]|uniref:PDDEXK-like family protein n=1 Tax=Saccharicrinis aurantiacus TaxID=1849719 RepID=UPI0024931066|nr:PD-(D/E)XK nuclease family protein [Saccharicrinis aurantiacus]
MLEIQSLLNQVKAKIEESERIAQLKGENFNIFSILNLESAENKTHSAFLCELLNPAGTHAFGDVFLKLFIHALLKENTEHPILKNFVTQGAKVKAELSIGGIDKETKTGGRLDIIITDTAGRNIIIENKIYAPDQDIQIERYCNYQTRHSIVFYLTLNGDSPGEKSRGNKKVGNDFYLLSYKDDIKSWLSSCQKEATDSPIVRESIKQYNILIKKLTNQLTSGTMSQEIKEIIKLNLKGAQGVYDNYANVLVDIRTNFRNAINDQLSTILTSTSITFNSIHESNANLVVSTPAKHVSIYIESFNPKSEITGLCVGFLVNLDCIEENKKALLFNIFKKFSLTQDDWWFGRVSLDIDIANINHLSTLADDKYLMNKAKEIAQTVQKYINENEDLIEELTKLLS